MAQRPSRQKGAGRPPGRSRAENPHRDLLLEKWGRRLAMVREALLGYESAADFAADIGVEAPTYRAYERGESLPPIDVLERICDVTGMTLDFLLLGRQPSRRADD